ncbi:glycosyltransferase family 4 protein [Fulvivirga sediminis]|uniref:Glycosyltransferase family 4 protein n=1 Tax=Fulvivirga sediminis TaxID=2803949 RepID=A0A937FAV9_9BACT|nr:glycosyltransferase family 4 protein [Fulvivirga sediminis]MBL3657809.1 glycosyltransferase family 4 protein [Fulvivirga sediminis]
MRIVLIHQYFKTPQEGGGIRSYHIVKHLKELGHDVQVITAYNKPKADVKIIDGIKISYLPVYYTNHLSFWSRVHAFIRFVWMSLKVIKKIQPVDLNYVITTPLTTGIIALYAKFRFRTPYVFEVGDLWPDAPIQLKVLNNWLLKKLAYWLEKKSYKETEKIVALSPDIKDIILQKLNKKKVEVITNMADNEFFTAGKKDLRLQLKYGVEDKFVITYAGTIGLANHLEYMLAAAEACLDNAHIQFMVAGEGARAQHMKNLVEEQNLVNVRFVPFAGKDEVRELLNVSDAVYVSFQNVPVLASGSPNKLFDGLAAGKLIIMNFEGWLKKIIEKNECGFYYNPEEPKQFYNELKKFVEDDELLMRAQINSRKLAEQSFDKQDQLKKLQQFLGFGD